MRILPCLMSMTVATLMLAAPALADDKKAIGAASGFLDPAIYDSMQEVRSPSGMKARRWMAPGVMLGQYDAVMLDKTTFYPAPQTTDQLSMVTLNQIGAYLDEAMRRELSGVVTLADQPGPKTLRLRPAITAAAAMNEGLKAYQLIPVALILSRGQTKKKAALAVEYEVFDTETGQMVAAGMREGEGAELKTMQDTLTLDQMKPVIDTWAKDMRAFMEGAKASK